MVIVGPEGLTRERYTPAKARCAVRVRARVLLAPGFACLRPSGAESRELMGQLLAREHPVDADVVVPVPDSGVAAALGYSAESGIPFRQALIRNHYVGRTFIEPSQAIRDFGVKLKLNPIRHLLEGKRVVLVDDSLVRGTTSKKSSAWCEAREPAKSICVSPARPTISPCYYGVDTPSERELIAANIRSKRFGGLSKRIRSVTSRSSFEEGSGG